MSNPLIALNWINFFLADVRDGLGPFLGIFLQQHGWMPDHIGYVTTLGGLAGMIATTPMGMLVDAIRAKRGVVIVAAFLVIMACSVNYFLPYFLPTAVAQMLTAVAGAAVPPAVFGITLGIVGPAHFDKQLGRNEAFNHAGNAFSALMAGIFSYFYGLAAVFVLMGTMALFSTLCVLRIRPQSIDYLQARGASKQSGNSIRFIDVLNNRRLQALAVTVTLFHLGNAAMLPLLSQAMVARGLIEDTGAGSYTAATIIIAQVAMIPMALFAARCAQIRGYNLILLLALFSLPIRGVVAACISSPWVVVPVQILDGVGAGLLGVAVPGLVARILRGTGHFNAGLAALMTIQSIGAALSASVAGVVARHMTYGAAFFTLAGIALLALLVWCLAFPLFKDSLSLQVGRPQE